MKLLHVYVILIWAYVKLKYGVTAIIQVKAIIQVNVKCTQHFLKSVTITNQSLYSSVHLLVHKSLSCLTT